ncbi:hypothetical protein [Clostridium manihotivorum]|uniref:Uncharacterized protein n=1 Tax=Clostridium manihotivorum TaxID=2320868 RepID=A0A410DNW4_9CLOT|nr:hypothetical protein [Clostridium manihotivorum]QAA30759.1 hypothetical protein C1I91_03295 [Clostridium manihotivorum]
MGTMHKEFVGRRKASSIVISIVVLCLMIVLSNSSEKVLLYNHKINIIMDPLLILLTLSFVGFQFIRCRTSYKYSIVADKLIIHRVNPAEQVTLENIKLKDIVFLGGIVSAPKRYPINRRKLYIGSIVGIKTYCCIYRDDNKYKKFFFQPSEDLVNKLEVYSARYKEVMVS